MKSSLHATEIKPITSWAARALALFKCLTVRDLRLGGLFCPAGVDWDRICPMKLSVSQRVLHEKYGLGVISEANSQYTIIEFDEHGSKKFLTRLVSLQSSDEPPPKRRRARKTTQEAGTTTKKKTTKKKTTTKKTTTKASKATKKTTKKA